MWDNGGRASLVGADWTSLGSLCDGHNFWLYCLDKSPPVSFLKKLRGVSYDTFF